MKKSSFQEGYSMLELIVYLAIFAVISLVLVKSLITSINTYAQAQEYRRLQNNGELVMERITREIRQAKTITAGSSTFDNNNGVLVLTGNDLSNTPQTVTFATSGNTITVTVNGTTSILTSSQVAPVSLVFRNVNTGGNNALKIELKLKTIVGPLVTSDFYNTVSLKGQ